MFRSKLIPAALAISIGLGSVGAVLASNSDRDEENSKEISAVLAAKTSLSDAIKMAESETKGKAIEARLENEDGVMRYEVEIAKDNTMQRVLIALDTGKIIKVIPADDDRDEEHGHDKD